MDVAINVMLEWLGELMQTLMLKLSTHHDP